MYGFHMKGRKQFLLTFLPPKQPRSPDDSPVHIEEINDAPDDHTQYKHELLMQYHNMTSKRCGEEYGIFPAVMITFLANYREPLIAELGV